MAKSPEALATPNQKVLDLARELETYIDEQIDTWTPGETSYPVQLGDPMHFSPLPVILKLLAPRYEAVGWKVEIGQGPDLRPLLTFVDPLHAQRATQLADRQKAAMAAVVPFGK